MTIQLVTEKVAAEILSVRPATLRRWRWSGEGPRFVKIGTRTIRYDPADLDAFLASGRQEVWGKKAS